MRFRTCSLNTCSVRAPAAPDVHPGEVEALEHVVLGRHHARAVQALLRGPYPQRGVLRRLGNLPRGLLEHAVAHLPEQYRTAG